LTHGFKDAEGKFHPIGNDNSGLHSSQVEDSNLNSINISDAKTLLAMKTKGFPEPRGSVGKKSAWFIETERDGNQLQQVYDIFDKMILDEVGLNPNPINNYLDSHTYGVNDTVNGKEYYAGFRLIPQIVGDGYRDTKKVLGFRLELPKEIDHKKWEEKLETKIGWGIKASGYKNNFGMTINIPASNPSKINLALPFLNEMISESITKQAENEVEHNERTAKHDERKVTGLDKHNSMIERLHQHGVVIGAEDYQDVIDTNHSGLESEFETRLLNQNNNSRYDNINLKTKIDREANVTYSINEDYGGGGLRNLTESQAERIVKIMSEDES
jgi:hypothetical protein